MTVPTEPAPLARQAGRFLVAGAGRTLFSLAVYWTANLMLPYRFAFTISFVLTILLSAMVSSRFVFATRLTPARAVAYVVVYVTHYLLSLELLVFAVERVGLPPPYAPFLVIPVMLPVGFLLERFALLAFAP